MKFLISMKRITSLILACFMAVPFMFAEEATVVNAEASEIDTNVKCQDFTASSWRDNWFLQAGAGINVPFVENMPHDRKVTFGYTFGVGKWISPYIAMRLNAIGGSIHWTAGGESAKGRYFGMNFEVMWDMLNSINGVNTNRVFSIVPYAGLGAACSWNFHSTATNIPTEGVDPKHRSWTIPVTAGIMFNFRLSKYVDFFVEGKAMFAGDNFNGCVDGNPIDVNIAALGGFTFNIGGKKFESVNPCDYTTYINQLNNQVNDLRGELDATSAALVAAEAQLPCPEVKEVECPEPISPLLSAVRFTLNSSKINDRQMINVKNVADWMMANPEAKVVVSGYADKGTGTSTYNQKLSERRAKRVYDKLVDYGVNEENLILDAHGSSVQPYEHENNWNRIVLFTIK